MAPFWDVDEETNFVNLNNDIDHMGYKVYNVGTPEEQKQIANVLAISRKNINLLLFYLIQNPEIWYDHPIAWGLIHTFDIHIPSWKQNINLIKSTNLSDKNELSLLNDIINKESVALGSFYNMQEMTPNSHGILGLNKPKEIINIDSYPRAKKRSMHLTLRNIRNGSGNNYTCGKLYEYNRIMDLVIHELTHTTCNDIYWKEDNHRPPYGQYHSMMRKWAKDCNII
jgi:hypothetical protein